MECEYQEFTDYSNYKLGIRSINEGMMGKVVLEDKNGNNLLLKFEHEVYNIKNHITKFLASEYIRRMGFECQEVSLGYYEGNECCCIKMFPYDITSLKNIGLSDYWKKYKSFKENIYDLDWLLSVPLEVEKNLKCQSRHF